MYNFQEGGLIKKNIQNDSLPINHEEIQNIKYTRSQ